MDSTLAQVLPLLLTSGVTGGLVSAYISNHFARRRDETTLLRSKLEELDLILPEYFLLVEKGLPNVEVRGESLSSSSRKLDGADAAERDKRFNQIRMLVRMYFPELDIAVERLQITLDFLAAGFQVHAADVSNGARSATSAQIGNAMLKKIEDAKARWRSDEAHFHLEISRVARSLLYWRGWLRRKRH